MTEGVDIRGSFEDLIVQHIEITGRRRREDRDDYNRSLEIKRALNRSQKQSAIKFDGRNFQPAHATDFAQNYLYLAPGKLFFRPAEFLCKKNNLARRRWCHWKKMPRKTGGTSVPFAIQNCQIRNASMFVPTRAVIFL